MDTLIELKNVSFQYPSRGSKPIVGNFSYVLKPGRRVGVFGPNGSGKTTLLKLCGGLLTPSHGDICFQGKRFQELSVYNRSRHVAWVTQPRAIEFPMQAWEVVRLGGSAQKPDRKWFLPNFQKDEKSILQAMEMTFCESLRDKDYSELSTGQRQLVQLARGFLQDSQVLLLDEVFANLDLGFRERVMERLKQWVSSKNRSAVLVSHDLNFLLEHMEVIILWMSSQAVFIGTPQEFFSQLDKLSLLFEGGSIQKFQHPLTQKDQLLFGLNTN